jgi:uncharacterized protein
MDGQVIDYRALLEEAILGVVRSVLERAATEGLPGEHHFYLTFATRHPGVLIPERVRREHPDEMTVVLQHQFWDLEVGQESFSVTLRFGGQPTRLTVPFAALRGFVDPAAELGLKLGPPEPATREAKGSLPAAGEDGGRGDDDTATVLPFGRRPDR